jgi:RNA polymerase sigma-70 factor (ECF subfamily)
MPGVLSDMEACIPALRRYASALLSGRQDADDLVHDCLVRALEHLHTRREDVEIRVWLFAIMHNLFISQLRKRRVRRRIEPLGDYTDVEPSLRASQEDRLHWRDLIRALNSLSEEQRTVVLLVTVENLSYAEVAHVLGIPIGTVMSRLARGRERLRQLTDTEARPALRRVQ